MLGLRHGYNLLVDYDPGWENAFLEEQKRLESALAGIQKGVEHFGSTSVEGLRAKPILDILVGVAPLSEWMECRLPLEGLGYDYAEHAGVAGHYVFGRGRDRTERTHLVHVVEFNGQSWQLNLAFRDALRADSDLRRDYQRTKENAALMAPEGRAKYNKLKHAFIEQIKARLLNA